MFSKKFCAVIVLVAVLMACFVDEVDARRKILRGRKAINRSYMRANAIPAWAIVLLVALGELVFGGLFYLLLKRLVLDVPLAGNYNVVQNNEYSP